MTTGSNKLAHAAQVAAQKGVKAAVPLYVEAASALASEQRWDAAVRALSEVLNAKEKKRGLFGSKEIDPLGPQRPVVGRQFAKLTRHAQINDATLEVLGDLATQNPDDAEIRLANAEGLYRAAYLADAIDEYRYCEKLISDNGAVAARLGELYALMSRNAEAVESLHRGIGELMQAQQFDEVPHFAGKLIEVAPQTGSEVSRWLESLPDDAFARQRETIAKTVETARGLGLDDARWAALEERLSVLAPAQAQVAAPSDAGETPRSSSAWDDPSKVEPASEDEIRMLFGTPESEPVPQLGTPGASNGAPTPMASAAPPGYTSSVSIGSTQPTSAGGLPAGLAAFTRRKADAAFNAGDFAGAATSYERLMKAAFDPHVAAPLVECYLGLQRFDDAVTLGLGLADHQASAGELEQAVATLALILEHTPDPDVRRRHEELLAAN